MVGCWEQCQISPRKEKNHLYLPQGLWCVVLNREVIPNRRGSQDLKDFRVTAFPEHNMTGFGKLIQGYVLKCGSVHDLPIVFKDLSC